MLNFIFSLSLFSFPSLILCGPAAYLQEPSSKYHVIRDCSTSTSRGRHNWNPFEWRVTEITSIVYSIIITVTETKHIESIVTMSCGACITSTPPHPSVTSPADVLETGVEPGTATWSAIPEVETLPMRCEDCNYYTHNHSPPSSSEMPLSPGYTEDLEALLMKYKPTSFVSDVGPPQAVSSGVEGSWNSMRQCLGKENHSYTVTFDDLDTPYIPRSYNLSFSDSFSIFYPPLQHPDYTAPSPPFAAISHPSNETRISSSGLFNLESMYIGCEYNQSCLILVRGLSPPEDRLVAEVPVRVTPNDANWKFVNFSDFGFNQISSIDFEVIDLETVDKGTLGLTLDQIRYNEEVSVAQDC